MTVAIVGLAGVAAWLSIGRRRVLVPAAAAEATEPARPVAVTVIHRYEPASPAAAQPLVASGGGAAAPAEPEPARARLQREFEALAPDAATEERNGALLHGLLDRLRGDRPSPVQSFVCRGWSCEARVVFQDQAHLQQTLNLLPQQEEWKRANLGFNAVPDDPSDPDCTGFTVFFTSPPPTGS